MEFETLNVSVPGSYIVPIKEKLINKSGTKVYFSCPNIIELKNVKKAPNAVTGRFLRIHPQNLT